MNRSMVIQSQLLATKFFVPMTSGTLISRPRLHTLLDESLKYPLTLVSAPRWLRQNDAALLLGTIPGSSPSSGSLDSVSLSKGAAFDKGELSLKFSPQKASP